MLSVFFQPASPNPRTRQHTDYLHPAPRTPLPETSSGSSGQDNISGGSGQSGPNGYASIDTPITTPNGSLRPSLSDGRRHGSNPTLTLPVHSEADDTLRLQKEEKKWEEEKRGLLEQLADRDDKLKKWRDWHRWNVVYSVNFAQNSGELLKTSLQGMLAPGAIEYVGPLIDNVTSGLSDLHHPPVNDDVPSQPTELEVDPLTNTHREEVEPGLHNFGQHELRPDLFDIGLGEPDLETFAFNQDDKSRQPANDYLGGYHG
jgi:hypothetical protein